MRNAHSPLLGVAWLRESFRPLRLQPVAYTGIVVFALLVSGMLSGIPFVGTLLASLWMPYASVLTGFAARDTLAGRTPVYATLVAIARDKTSRYPLLMLGLLSSVGMELCVMVFELLGRDALGKWRITSEGVDMASIASNFPLGAFAAALLVYVPLLMMTLFAPLLIVQMRQSVGKSLFYSFFGVLRSILPALVWLLGMGLVSGLILAAFEALFIALGVPRLLAFVAPLVVAIISAACQAGIWVMFRDIFAKSSPDGRMPEDLTPGEDGSIRR